MRLNTRFFFFFFYMRKFAYSLIACVASVFVAQSFAQPRDLFAEFEAEAEAAQSSDRKAVSKYRRQR